MISGHGGNIHELGRRLGCRPADITDLSSNVNPLGPPPGLREFLAEQLDTITALPEVDNRGTIRSYAEFLGVPTDRILTGNGTTQFIYSIPRGLAVKEALILGPTYSDYADACRLHGVPPRFCLSLEQQSFRPDIDRLEKQIGTADTVFICNPNNPTGALIAAGEIERLCRRHPQVRFIVDESYLPFVAGGDQQSLVHSGLTNLIVLLSISKIFRIPGLRVGFIVAPARIVADMAGTVWPWSVNALAQAAVRFVCDHKRAIDAFVTETRNYLDRERRVLHDRLACIPGLEIYPSTTSFILIRLPAQLSAATVWSRLAEERVLIRNCGNFHGLSERFIRISPKSPAANRKVAERLAELAQAASA
jgi:threonine-phosphate decarboxylase